MNQSSIFFGELCRKIDQNMGHVGVPIIHGVHGNGASQFKQFLLQNTNQNKVSQFRFKKRLHSTERLIKMNRETIKPVKNETNK